MEAYIKKECLTIPLEGRIDSTNSAQIGQEIDRILADHPGLPLVLDAEKLQYISSSGLRIFMRLLKNGQKDLTIQNVSPEVYEIFEVTGINRLLKVQKQMRRLSVEGCPVIGQGAFGTVYRLDGDTVVKVYRGGESSLPLIREETAKARQAFVNGIPTAIPFDIVRVGDQYGSVFEMIDAQSCNDLAVNDPAALDALLPRYAGLLKSLHAIELKPGELPFARDIYLENLSAYAPFLEENTCRRVRDLLAAMPDDLHLLHGDVQLKNVMISSGEITLIDMDTICTGNPVFEFAALFVTYVAFNEDEPDNSLKFAGIPRDAAYRIYRDTLKACLGHPGEEALAAAERKVQLLGCLRFLTILTVEMKDLQSPLKDLRIQHTAEHLKTLVTQVEDLTI